MIIVLNVDMKQKKNYIECLYLDLYIVIYIYVMRLVKIMA